MAQPKFKKTKAKHIQPLAICTESSYIYFNGNFSENYSLAGEPSDRKVQKIGTSLIYSLLSGEVSSHYEAGLSVCPLVLDFGTSDSIDSEILATANTYMEDAMLKSKDELDNQKVESKLDKLLALEDSQSIKVIILAALLCITNKKDRKKAFKSLKKSLALSLSVRYAVMQQAQ